MEQFFLVPLFVYKNKNNLCIASKQQLPKYKPEQYPTYQKGTIKKEIKQHLIASSTLLINKVLESPCIKVSNFNTLSVDGVETGVLLKVFTQRLQRKNVPVPGIYSTLLDAASITPDLVINRHAKGKERGAGIPVKVWGTNVPDTLHARICRLWFCAQFGKSSETLSVKGQRVCKFKESI